MPTLDDLRNDIDRVDEVLVRLLNERARVACEIGRIKKELGIEVYQPEREAGARPRPRHRRRGPARRRRDARLFERIIDEARRLSGG
jgi:chorismate mutase